MLTQKFPSTPKDLCFWYELLFNNGNRSTRSTIARSIPAAKASCNSVLTVPYTIISASSTCPPPPPVDSASSMRASSSASFSSGGKVRWRRWRSWRHRPRPRRYTPSVLRRPERLPWIVSSFSGKEASSSPEQRPLPQRRPISCGFWCVVRWPLFRCGHGRNIILLRIRNELSIHVNNEWNAIAIHGGGVFPIRSRRRLPRRSLVRGCYEP